jgi:competence protein ComGC
MGVEQFRIDGDRLLSEVKRLVAEGNVRRDQHQAGAITRSPSFR